MWGKLSLSKQCKCQKNKIGKSGNIYFYNLRPNRLSIHLSIYLVIYLSNKLRTNQSEKHSVSPICEIKLANLFILYFFIENV